MATFQPKITRVEAPASIQGRVRAARELAKQGKVEEAVAVAQEAVTMDPNSKIARMVLGSLKARQFLPDEAFREFREVLRIDPLNVPAYMCMARIYLKKKEYTRAQECLESALRIDEKSPAVHFTAGKLAIALKDGESAKQHLSEALKFDPRMVSARIQLATVLRAEGKYPESLGQLNAAVRIEPESYKAHEALGWLHLVRKDFGGARESFEKAVSLQPENEFTARLGLVEALIEDGEVDRAETVLRMGSSRTEGRAGLHKLWGDLYVRRGLYPEAVEEYKAARLIASTNDEDIAEISDSGKEPAEGDIAGWKKLAEKLKDITDAYRDKSRLRIAPGDEDGED